MRLILRDAAQPCVALRRDAQLGAQSGQIWPTFLSDFITGPARLTINTSTTPNSILQHLTAGMTLNRELMAKSHYCNKKHYLKHHKQYP